MSLHRYLSTALKLANLIATVGELLAAPAQKPKRAVAHPFSYFLFLFFGEYREIGAGGDANEGYFDLYRGLTWAEAASPLIFGLAAWMAFRGHQAGVLDFVNQRSVTDFFKAPCAVFLRFHWLAGEGFFPDHVLSIPGLRPSKGAQGDWGSPFPGLQTLSWLAVLGIS